MFMNQRGVPQGLLILTARRFSNKDTSHHIRVEEVYLQCGWYSAPRV